MDSNNLKQKHIDAMREARLWCGQIIIPAITAGLILWSNYDVRNTVSKKNRRFQKEKHHQL